ncbi:MAG: hypothetical protein NUW12_07140 [Firmicutes bacterium]|nr:hypothetical protein [Bacillota bacterium]MDH7495924.1 hypothetical protein [Bacillota bacterium]
MESVREVATVPTARGNGTAAGVGATLPGAAATPDARTTGDSGAQVEVGGGQRSLGEQAFVQASVAHESQEEGIGRIARQRRKRHVFTEYEDKLLMKVLDRRSGERKRELERLADLFGVPYLTLRHRFYTVIKRRVSETPSGTVTEVTQRAEETVTAGQAQGQQIEESWPRAARDPMEELLTLPGRVERIEKRLSGMLDLKGFVDRLIDINRQLDREQQLLEELARKEREIQRMREELQKKIQRINAREEELSDLYSQLETTLHQFMNLSSIDKLKVLGDFTVKVETVIDKFGNVIRRRPVVVP